MTKKQQKIFNIVVVIAIILLTIATVTKVLQEDTFYMIAVRRIYMSKWNACYIR